MEPLVTKLSEDNGRLLFTLSGVNVSIANALRRIVISEIPCVVLRTSPHSENRVNITVNTTRLNNELIKQRLSCIPVHISDTSTPIENYEVIIDKKNNSDVIEYVTTGDIVIKDIKTGEMLSHAMVSSIFPTDSITGDYIDISRLRPRLSEDIDGEHLKFNATLDIGIAKDNGSFNVVSTCSYGNTKDSVKIKGILDKMSLDMKADGLSEETIAFKKKDWLLLNSELISITDSFDFVVETIGQFTNQEIIFRATNVMIDKVKKFKSDIYTDASLIVKSESTIENGFDIKLISEDYTLGKAIEFVLYNNHYDRHSSKSDNILTFCGFRKPHPHIDESMIRLGFVDNVDSAVVIQIIVNACKLLETMFSDISSYFSKTD
jgi:DNA-directed RNA polymerase alpha subunit/DNA-directed RNA polymerase subunit L